MDEDARIFEAERQRLTAICYRMLGERSAAEDTVQDTWMKWADADQRAISSPAAWLTRVATRLAIDALRSARARRETYVGPWLPEPLVSTGDQPVEASFIQAQECGLALLWAMERLDASERAAFILREAFDAEYSEIGDVLQKSEAACRQMVSRARKRVQSSGPRFDVPNAQIADLMGRFIAATSARDFEAVKQLLSPTSVAVSDGGANKPAARRPLVGPAEIAQVLFSLLDKYRGLSHWQLEPCQANGAPALISRVNGGVDAIITMMPDDTGTIAWLYSLRAPEKLRGLN